MGDWKEKDLNAIFNLAYGKNLPTSEFTGEGYNVFGANGIIGKYSRYTHEDEEVLVSCRGEYSGVIRFSTPKSYITNNSIVCSLKEEFDKKFLYYSLSSIPRYTMVSGSAQPQVVIMDLKKIKIVYPENISEQSTIASILATIDQAIEKTEQLIAKYERIKTGLMQDLLTRGIDEQGNIRSEETHEFKDSVLGRIPKEWEVEELQQFIEPNSPIVYGILMPGYGHDNGIPVIKVKDIKNDKIEEEGLLLTSPEIAAAYERSKLEEGDLLFTIRGTVGRCAFVPKSLHGANITQDTARMRIKVINPKFVRLYFEMPFPKAFIELNTIGLAVKGINLRELRKLFIAKPCKEESDRIVEKVDSIESFIENERKGLNKLLSQKAALMQDLLTGKIRVDALMEN